MDPKALADTRRKNLDRLIGDPGKRGRIVNFARKYDLDPTYIGMLLNGHRNIGERTARRLERKIGIPAYSLDSASGIGEAPQPYATDSDTKARLEAIIQQLSDEDRERAIRILEAAFAAEAKEEKPE